EHDDAGAAHRIAQPLRLRAADRDALAACAPLERGRDLALPPRRLVAEPAAHMERLGAEPDQPLVRRTPEGSEDLQVVDRFQEVGLARAVVADDRDAGGRESELELREVPEVAETQFDADQRAGRGSHGHAGIYPGAGRPATPVVASSMSPASPAEPSPFRVSRARPPRGTRTHGGRARPQQLTSPRTGPAASPGTPACLPACPGWPRGARTGAPPTRAPRPRRCCSRGPPPRAPAPRRSGRSRGSC